LLLVGIDTVIILFCV